MGQTRVDGTPNRQGRPGPGESGRLLVVPHWHTQVYVRTCTHTYGHSGVGHGSRGTTTGASARVATSCTGGHPGTTPRPSRRARGATVTGPSCVVKGGVGAGPRGGPCRAGEIGRHRRSPRRSPARTSGSLLTSTPDFRVSVTGGLDRGSREDGAARRDPMGSRASKYQKEEVRPVPRVPVVRGIWRLSVPSHVPLGGKMVGA